MSLLAYRDKIKSRLGDLWWYTLILFCVQRLGDGINMFVGLWLVPRYVPQSELGAVIPLMQIGAVLGLPLMIVTGLFAKFLNTYAAFGELGKVKALLRDCTLLVLLLFLGILTYAWAVMPPLLTRLRVVQGSLGWLIVISGAVSAMSPIAVTALQALKKFRLITWISLVAAPIRLAAMLIFLPIRGLSGYLAGQTLPHLMTIGISLLGLRSVLGRATCPTPYWREDGRRILTYMASCGILISIGVFQIAVESFVIRHRLPAFESAAYYMISRFAESGAAMGMTLIFIAFPMMSEQQEKGNRSQKLMWQAMSGTLSIGLVFTLLFLLAGRFIMDSVAVWRPYISYVPHMAALTLIHTIRLATACFFNFEMAGNRTRFLVYFPLFLLLGCVVLYGMTGYRFFAPYLPEAWMEAITLFNPCRLNVVLGVMSVFTVLPFAAVVLHACSRNFSMSGLDLRPFRRKSHG